MGRVWGAGGIWGRSKNYTESRRRGVGGSELLQQRWQGVLVHRPRRRVHLHLAAAAPAAGRDSVIRP